MQLKILRLPLTIFLLLIIAVGLPLYLSLRVLYVKHQWNLLIHNDSMEYDTMNQTSIEFLHSNFNDYKSKMETIKKMKSAIAYANQMQIVYNDYLHYFLNPRVPVIVIQVYEKDNISLLIKSLQNVPGIIRTLVIFSHGYYDDEVNILIERIEFIKFIQIFYPYSTQLHTNSYPGDDPKFCKGNYLCENTRKIRNAKLAEKKLFWWWTVNHVFDHLEVTKSFNGYVLFLEGDQYVADDLMYIFKQLQEKIPSLCPDCSMINLGGHSLDIHQFHLEEGYAKIEAFGVTESKSIAFNRTLWSQIKELRHHFCYYDDYNWDHSLWFLASRTPQGKFLMLSITGPRVFSTGRCKSEEMTNCTAAEIKLNEILLFMKKIRRGLFPRTLLVSNRDDNSTGLPEVGGWSDVRDQELCMFFGSKARLRFNEFQYLV